MRSIKKSGFTLVELLVVIGIISVLVAVLLPALNKARQSAQTVTCMSNMRQIGLAIAIYVNDNNGYIPPACAKAYSTYDATFDVLLDPYLKAMNPPMLNPYAGVAPPLTGPAQIWRCPADNVQRNLVAQYGTLRDPVQPRSYVMDLWVSAFQNGIYYHGQSAKLSKIKGALGRIVLMGELWSQYTALRCNVDSATMFQRPPMIMSPTAPYGTHPRHTLNLLMSDFSVMNVAREDYDERYGGAPYPTYPFQMYEPWN